MADTLFEIFIFLGGLFAVYLFCNAACVYRDLRHRYVKAFYATSRLQRFLLPRWGRKDVKPCDYYKMTYIGYIVSLICICSAMIIIPIVIILYFKNISTAIWLYLRWCGICIVLDTGAFVVQMIDSFINYILDMFGKY